MSWPREHLLPNLSQGVEPENRPSICFQIHFKIVPKAGARVLRSVVGHCYLLTCSTGAPCPLSMRCPKQVRSCLLQLGKMRHHLVAQPVAADSVGWSKNDIWCRHRSIWGGGRDPAQLLNCIPAAQATRHPLKLNLEK